MGWAGIDLNISTCLIAVVAVGIAVDDTIHYLTTFGAEIRRTGNREQAILDTVRTVGRPILVTSVALSAGFLVVCLSNFQPIRQFGILSSITMAVALLADLFLLPPLLITLRIGEKKPPSTRD
jgi:predicted RND superfamily exporter protein